MNTLMEVMRVFLIVPMKNDITKVGFIKKLYTIDDKILLMSKNSMLFTTSRLFNAMRNQNVPIIFLFNI